MKLLNFSIPDVVGAIALQGMSQYWDLHNCGLFKGFEFNSDQNVLTMTWTFSSDVKFSSCRLVFRGITFLLFLPSNGVVPLTEDTCVSGIFRVTVQNVLLPSPFQYRVKDTWREGEIFNLVFLLQSGRSIEIGAETTELLEC